MHRVGKKLVEKKELRLIIYRRGKLRRYGDSSLSLSFSLSRFKREKVWATRPARVMLSLAHSPHILTPLFPQSLAIRVWLKITKTFRRPKGKGHGILFLQTVSFSYDTLDAGGGGWYGRLCRDKWACSL